jgi:hypothetical protein
MSTELLKKIDQVLNRAPENRHSYFQLKYFVIGKEPTIQAKMWQCLRELQSKRESIDAITLEITDGHDNVELIEIKIEKENLRKSLIYEDKYLSELNEKETEIKIKKLKRRKDNLSKNITKLEDKVYLLIQEARFFLESFEALEKMEPLKDYDDFDAQSEFWEAKISEEINLRILTRQTLSPDLIKTALSLPDDSNIKTEVNKLINTFIANQLRFKNGETAK